MVGLSRKAVQAGDQMLGRAAKAMQFKQQELLKIKSREFSSLWS